MCFWIFDTSRPQGESGEFFLNILTAEDVGVLFGGTDGFDGAPWND